MARSLVESMAGDVEPDQYTDGYRAALESVIEANRRKPALAYSELSRLDTSKWNLELVKKLQPFCWNAGRPFWSRNHPMSTSNVSVMRPAIVPSAR